MSQNKTIDRKKELKEISGFLKSLMEKHNLSAPQLALQLGVTRRTVHNWTLCEHGIGSQHIMPLVNYFTALGENVKPEDFMRKM